MVGCIRIFHVPFIVVDTLHSFRRKFYLEGVKPVEVVKTLIHLKLNLCQNLYNPNAFVHILWTDFGHHHYCYLVINQHRNPISRTL